jgi:DNA-directed RNA polymerase specialized sigma24 family protein
MESEESFDAFYRETRRRILHQAFALTGDLAAAQAAVRDAYVSAWHHWRKVERLPDREAWVRPHAWNLAQRRHAGRIWHRNKGLSPEHRTVLEGLARLPAAQRRTLLLVQLAAIPMEQAARELGITREATERNLQAATANLAVHLDTDATGLRLALLDLAEATGDVTLPRAPIVRRAGRKRRQAHTVVAVAAATVVAIGSGAVAYQPPAPGVGQAAPATSGTGDQTSSGPTPDAAGQTQSAQSAQDVGQPTADDLLDADQIRRLGADSSWTVERTHANTTGDGINTVCQKARFADPDGLAALVRTFAPTDGSRRRAVQTVELSASPAQARRGFETTLGWYAGCQVGRLQLLHAYKVDHIGDQASVLTMREWRRPVTTYSVAVARIGSVTTSTVGRTVGTDPPPTAQVVQSLADSVAMLCGRSGSTGCAKQPTFRAVPPPPAGGERGVLAVPDLPPVGNIDKPWVATDADPEPNPSMTTCDRARFGAAGARSLRARIYLVPEANLPSRFGISETYGVFPTKQRARRFVAEVRRSVAGCEARDLATRVGMAHHGRVDRSGAEWSIWTLHTEVTRRMTVDFHVGFVRTGRVVAQVTFVPAPKDDITAERFRDLVIRAGDRLLELR